MNSARFLVNSLLVAYWPVLIRKPIILSVIKRKKLKTELPFTTKFHGFSFHGDARNLIDYHILSRGAFEPGLSEILCKWAKFHPHSAFIDVGANVGIHTLSTCKSYHTVISIEAYPPLADSLKKTVERNKINNVSIHCVALGDKTGTVYFQSPPANNLGLGRIEKDGNNRENKTSIKINSVKGDDLLKIPIPISAIKIDTEGAELSVIKGLAQILNSQRPLVVTEILDNSLEASESLKSLFPPNYNFFSIQNIKRKAYKLEPWEAGSGDILAIASEKMNLLQIELT
jgi:FkbM family methyltransferase